MCFIVFLDMVLENLLFHSDLISGYGDLTVSIQ